MHAKSLKTPNIFHIFLLFVFLGVLLGCHQKQSKTPPPRKPSPKPSAEKQKKQSKPITFEGTTLKSRQKGKDVWVLKASKILYDEQNKWATAQKVSCTFYYPNSTGYVTIVAKGVKVNIENFSLYFKGEINGTSSDGKKFTVKKLMWDGSKKVLIGKGDVKFVKNGSLIRAREMFFYLKTKKLKFTGGVTGKYCNLSDIFEF